MERERQRELGVWMDDGLSTSPPSSSDFVFMLKTLLFVLGLLILTGQVADIRSGRLAPHPAFRGLGHLGPPGHRQAFHWDRQVGERPLFGWWTEVDGWSDENENNKKYDDLWWWMKRGYEKCIKGEPGVGDPGLWDRHKLLLHLLRGERSRSGLPQPSEGKRGKIHLVSILLLVLIAKMLER